MFGQDVDIRHARTVSDAVDMLLKALPDLILLDDYVGPNDTAIDSLPLIRHAQFEGPVVIVSGRMSRQRRTELMAKGADETINKDDLDSSAIAEAMLRLVERGRIKKVG